MLNADPEGFVKHSVIKTALILFIIISASSGYNIQAKSSAKKEDVSPKIKIASFNMQIFGKKKVNRPHTLTVLAETAANFDIIALQEIGSNKSSASDEECSEIMELYVAKINEVKGKKLYSFIYGNQYAIVYRSDKIKLNGSTLYNGQEIFSYTPLIANFETLTDGTCFDFSIITIHTSPKLAEDEIPALRTVMNETVNLYSEPDVICLGDFNADGDYYDEGTEDWLSGFDVETYITGIPNSYDTTVAESENTYDRIQMTESLRSDYTGNSGVFRFGEFYDITECEGGRTTAGTEKAISDHYPVWCEYYADRDQD
jgi:endonuclease/exonuclease/phosphatase family metal-dependent hydrolase